jgi:hypothetical protein
MGNGMRDGFDVPVRRAANEGGAYHWENLKMSLIHRMVRDMPAPGSFSQLCFAVSVLAAVSNVGAFQQVADLKYKPPLLRPAYEMGKGPSVIIDEAHYNFHTADERYEPFAEFLRRDGYRVQGRQQSLAPNSLQDVDVLVIANPLHERNVNDWSLPTPSAFAQGEIGALRAWVEQGGSLFLIVDHMPFPGAAGELARVFGMDFSNGYAKAGHWGRGQPNTFDYATGLKESAVTRGRSAHEQVTKVATFGGSAFKPARDAIPILVFSAGSVSFETKKAPGITPDAPRVSIESWCQGAVMKVGNGRIAVFGEAAMFSAQLAGPRDKLMGMNAPEAIQNHQLLLNVMHWLTRVPGMPD